MSKITNKDAKVIHNARQINVMSNKGYKLTQYIRDYADSIGV